MAFVKSIEQNTVNNTKKLNRCKNIIKNKTNKTSCEVEHSTCKKNMPIKQKTAIFNPKIY